MMQNLNKEKRNKPIYSLFNLKCICAFLVVLLHTNMIGKGFLMPIAAMAVPLFFMISGFFLLNDDNRIITSNKLKKQLQKLGKLFFISNLIYLSIDIPAYIFNWQLGFGVPYLYQITTLKFWLMQFIIGDCIAAHLWFLTATILALVIIAIFDYFQKINLLFRGLPILILSNILIGRYSFLLGNTSLVQIEWYCNFIFPGLEFIIIGMWIKKNINFLLSKLGKNINSIFLLAMVCYYIESFILYKLNYKADWGNLTILTPIVCILCFVMCIQKTDLGKNTFLNTIGKEFSTQIYVYHILCIWICNLIIKRILHINISSIETIVVFGITLMLCYGLKCIQSNFKFSTKNG